MFRSEHDMSIVLDALVHLDSEGTLALDAANEGRSEELTKVKRQLTAAKAREAKQKKKIGQLEKEVWHTTEQLGLLREEVNKLQENPRLH